MSCIDPKAVPDLFRKHDLKPIQNLYRSSDPGDRACCIITALYVDKHGFGSIYDNHVDDLDIENTVGCERYLTFDARSGLIGGWDGSPPEVSRRGPEFDANYDLGMAAWQACVDDGLVQLDS